MSESTNKYEGMTPIEEMAARELDTAFEANSKAWKDIHARQYRLYKSVRNFPRKPKKNETSSADRKGLPKTKTSNRSNIQIGLMWALHNTALSIGSKSIIEGEELVELLPRRGVQDLKYLDEMSDYIEELFTDDVPNIKGQARKALWDIYGSGASILVPSWRQILRQIRLKKGEDYEETKVDLGGYPVFDHYPTWDSYPTAGATDPDDVHEWILSSKMSVAELRNWEKQGLIKNLDKVIEQLQRDEQIKTKGNKGERENTKADESVDGASQIEILISYCLFPLYKGMKYFDDSGGDRSKDEVECIMIKAKHADPMMLLDRNPFACQKKSVILSGWYSIPGELYPISVFEIAEKLIIHHENIFNLIQDGANGQIYPTEIVPKDGCEEAELGNANAPGRRIHMDNDDMREGVFPKYMDLPTSILVDMYSQRDYSYQLIQTITTINDYVQGMMPEREVKAAEVNELTQRAQALFHQSAIDIEASLMKPIWEWMIILLAEFSDDEQIATEMGIPPEIGVDPMTGVQTQKFINPFKQFMPVLPNPKFKIKMNAALKAAENQANQMLLQNMIEIGKEMLPMPIDETGTLYVPNVLKMYFDMMKMSALRDIDSYKLVVPGPEEIDQLEQQQLMEGQGGPGAGNIQ